MKTQKIIILVAFLSLLPKMRSEGHSAITFIENKRQWESVIKFKSEIRGGALFFETNAITYAFYDPDYLEKIAALKSGSQQKSNFKLDSLVECYAYRIHFENANKNSVIKGSSPLREYHNYYLGSDPTRWSVDVRKYESIEYCDMYDGINLRFYEKYLTYKYEFKVAPGANPSQICMRYEGVDKLSLQKNSLFVKVGKHQTEERKPFAYQIDEEGNQVEIACSFVLDGKVVRFALDDYDKTKELIIDPTLIFASYSGSTADNWGYTATYDKEQNLYGGGTVYGMGYPTTLGCYKSYYAGTYCNIAITKFSANGSQRIYSTYLGGNYTDVPHSMIVGENDELYILATTSSRNYPVTSDAYDTSFHGGPSYLLTSVNRYQNGACIAVSRFNAGGTQLLSSTFFGGNGIDGLSTSSSLCYNYSDEVRGEIQLDASNNVYIVSSTSSTNLPTSSNAFQKNYGGGNQDGCIAKFTYNLQTLTWCSYFGGSADDAIYNMFLDKSGNLYICGGTTSVNLPTSFNAVYPVHQGDRDGFVAKISTNGTQILQSTYYGREGYDQAYLVTLDKDEYVYVMGQTDAAELSWVTGNVWHSGRGQFVSKLSNDLSNVEWSTSFGSSRATTDISPTALMVDICRNIHISGWGGLRSYGYGSLSTIGLPTTSDAWQTNTDGSDFYFISLEEDATNLGYATFFGGHLSQEHVDGGTSRFDKKGVIYQAVCAGCPRNQDFPVFPRGSIVSDSNRSNNCNLGVIKLDYGLQSAIADFSAPNMVCAPYTVNFINNSQSITNNVHFFWNFGDGRTSTNKNPNILYTTAGTYLVTLIVTDSSTCNIVDSITKPLVVLGNSIDTLPKKFACADEPIEIGILSSGVPNTIYTWVPNVGLNNYTISNPTFSDNVSRQYTLYINYGLCIDTLIQQVEIRNFPQGRQYTSYKCMGDTVHINADTSSGANYFIFSNYSDLRDTLNSSSSSSYIDVFLDKDSRTYYILRSDGYCFAKDTQIVHASSFGVYINPPEHLCLGDSTTLFATVFDVNHGFVFNYQWSPTTAIIGDYQVNHPLVSPKSSTFLVVEVRNEYGCLQKDSVLVGVSDIQAAVTQQDISCYGLTDGSISINPVGGAVPYAYNWAHTSMNTNYIYNLYAGSYSVKISDKYNCSIERTFKIIEPGKLSVHLEDTIGLVYCDDLSMGRALAVGSGGVPPYSFHWMTGDTTALAENLYAGEYFLLMTDINGCRDSLIFEVRDTSDMKANYVSKEITCFGDCDGNVLLQVIRAAEPYTILWTTGETENYRDSLCAGTYDVLITDDQHCKRRLFPIVKNIEPIRIDSSVIFHPYCFGMKDGSIMVTVLGGNPPYKYYWDGMEGGAVLSDLMQSGQYKLYVIDRKECDLDTVFILPYYDTLSNITYATKVPCKDICIGEAGIQVFGGAVPYSYNWSNGYDDSVAYNLCEGIYTITVSDSNLCQTSAIIQIENDTTIFPQGITAWADTTEIYKSQSITLYGTDLGSGFSYDWSPSDGVSSSKGTKVTATPLQSTTYKYTVTDEYGCQKSATVYIFVNDVICKEPYIFVPNTFSPNEDGHNDILYVRGLTLIKIDFAVYDRWGERIFATTDINIGWDGTYKGKPCQPGVYVYYLTATCIGGGNYIKKGNITLMR